jgi:hypothetical protein
LQSGKRWLAQLILKLWDIAWDLWEHRNNIAHSANSDADLQQINNEVQALLAMNEYPATAAYLFSKTTREHLAIATITVKKSCLDNYRAHVKYASKVNARDNGLQAMQQNM